MRVGYSPAVARGILTRPQVGDFEVAIGEMTLRYAHLSPTHKKSAVDALEGALTGSAEKAEKRA